MVIKLAALRTVIVVASFVMMVTGVMTPAAADESPLYVKVSDHKPVQPGEHPRLLFREADVKGLREKVQTPVGRAMLARLKYLLGGGESMPTEYNKNPPVNIGPEGPSQLKPGAFTVNHAAGFGMLYQLTGDAKYADLARQCLDKVFAGQVDRDERYSWKKPGTGFRISGVLQGVAIAYDLCYDAWPDDYRRAVVQKIQDVEATPLRPKRTQTLESLAKGGGYPPSSNHYGAYIAGPGFAALAIKGDPGADDARLNKLLDTVEKSMHTVLTEAYGDGGWFGEGTGSDKTAMQPGLIGLFHSMRVARGKDWCAAAPNGRMIMLTRALEMTNGPDAVTRPPRGLYAHGTESYYGGPRDAFRDQGGWSSDGLFCIGIGALPPRYRPGMKWIYENFVEPDVAPTERIYEARIDPLHGVYAIVNWPIEVEAENPAKTFPLAVHDSVHDYVLARSGFDVDRQEILFTGLGRTGPVGFHKTRADQDVWVWFSNYRISMRKFNREGITNWRAAKDGSATFKNGDTAWAIDYSSEAGCEGVIAATGRVRTKVAKVFRGQPVPVKELDLNGKWDGGVTIEHKGQTVTASQDKAWKQASGTLDGRELTMKFGEKGPQLVGRISSDGNRIEWSNGYTWKRNGTKGPRWSYKPGEPIKVSDVKLAGQKVTLVTIAADGKHPKPEVDGNGLKLGDQTISLTDGRLVLRRFGEQQTE